MTLFAGRSTIHRLHKTVQRNIARNHQARYESSQSNTTTQSASPASPPPAGNASTSTSSSSAPAALQRTIPGPGWAWIDPLKKPFRAYAGMQKRSPLLTQWESALVIWYLGDLASQVVSTNAFLDAQYEPSRGLRAMFIGSISAIPGYKWFQFLGNHFNYRSHMLSIAVKVVVNQTCFTPLFGTYFFGMQTLLSGGSFGEAWERVKMAVPVSWKNSWKLWPAVTAFSFTFVAPQNRNIFSSVIAIGWQAYLTWLNRREEEKQSKAFKRVEDRGRVGEVGEGRRGGEEEKEPKTVPKKRKRRKAEDEKEGEDT